MSIISDGLVRLRALFLRHREEQEMDEELRDHIEREVAERMRGGASEVAARREAQLAFGGAERYKEQVRDARGTRGLEDLAADIRYAGRALRRNPAFTVTAFLVLALGLGASTVAWSVVQAVILAELPYPEPDRLVRVVEQNSPTNRWALSTADVLAIRERQQVFEAWGEIQRSTAALSGVGAPERITIGRVSAGWFDAVGIAVAAGRPIQRADEAVEAPPAMVISDRLAARRFGSPPSALGQSLNLDGVSHEIVGVLPSGRNDLGGVVADAWPALTLRPPVRRGPFWLGGLGRLKPGVSIEAAARDLASVSAGLLPAWSDFRDSTARLTPVPLREVVLGASPRQVALLAGAVGIVLLLAIVNVASLVLVRATAREPELAVRVMLGAGRRRIARLLVTENLVVTLTAGVAGLLLAKAGLGLAVAQLPSLPALVDVRLDWRAVAVGLGAALVAGVVVSLSALGSVTAAVARYARGQRGGADRRTGRIRAAFVVSEFALAWPLLVLAGLVTASLSRLQQVDPGFDPARLSSVSVTLPGVRYPDAASVQDFWQRALQRVAGIPGVSSVGLVTELPPDRSGSTDNFNLASRPVPEGQAEPQSPWYHASASYFETLGMRVIDGRGFLPADTLAEFPVVIVSRSWARRYLGEVPAVGQQLVQGGCYQCPRTTIIGVVADIRNLGPSLPADAVYGPLTQAAPRSMSLVVRSAGVGVEAAVRDAVRGLDPDLPTATAMLEDRLDASLSDPRRWARALSVFSAVGLVLSSIGVFGLMAYAVRQRRREIGVRLALGASPGAIVGRMVWRGMSYAAMGSVAGVGLAWLASHRAAGILFGVSPGDARTFAVVGLVLLGTAAVASWLPARRAARIRPVEAME